MKLPPIPVEVRDQPLSVQSVDVPEVLLYIDRFTTGTGNRFDYVIPPGQNQRIQWIWLSYVAANTATPRQIRVTVNDENGIEVARFDSLSQQPIATTADYFWIPGCSHTALPAGGTLTAYVPTPPLLLPSNWTVRVWDALNLDAANDKFVVAIVGTREMIV